MAVAFGRIVHTAHGWGFNREQPRHVYRFYVWLERICARFTSAIVVVGTPNRDEGLALGIGRPEQYRLIRSGIEIQSYRDVAISREQARDRAEAALREAESRNPKPNSFTAEERS